MSDNVGSSMTDVLKFYWRRYGAEKPPENELLLVYREDGTTYPVRIVFCLDIGSRGAPDLRWVHDHEGEFSDVPMPDDLWLRAIELPILPSGRRIGE